MPNIGPLEIAIVLIIALLVFGPKRLPDLGRSLGRGITEFREGLSNVGTPDDDEDLEGELDEEGTALPPAALEAAEVPDSVLPGVEPDITEVTAAPGQESQSSGAHTGPAETAPDEKP